MNTLRPFLAVFLTLALTVLSPGLGAVRAEAAVVAGVAASAASAGTSIGAAGAALGLPVRAASGSALLSPTGLPSLSPLILGGGVSLSPSIAPSGISALGPSAGIAEVPALRGVREIAPASSQSSPRGPPAGIKAAKTNGAPSKKASAEKSYVELIVMFDGAQKPMVEDIHMSRVDLRGAGRYAGTVLSSIMDSMDRQLEGVGVDKNFLRDYDANPIATYRRINAATIRVAADRAGEFRAEMEAKNYSVWANEKRELVRPIEDDPGFDRQNLPSSAKLDMPDTLKLSTADKVHKIARERWGDPGAGGLRGALLRLFGKGVPQPKVAVLDTGADTSHKLMKGVSQVKNMTSGANVDDNGHGSWVTSMVLWFAPWLKSVTHYKIFSGDSTTLDTILKALTEAGNDGNLIMSNSWGSGAGDPNSPDSKLVEKLAQEGRIMVFAAGNSGYSGANTIGSPAIVHYRDPASGTPRVLAVAATDREKAVTGFSSKGPGSRRTGKDYPRKPDLAEQGENTEAAWPANLKPDRVDPELGPVRAISGTSMSTPKMAGTIALLASLFGVTETGEKLDRIVDAVTATLSNERNQAATAIGDGFNEVYAAYETLSATMAPVQPGRIAKAMIRSFASRYDRDPEDMLKDPVKDSMKFLSYLFGAVAAVVVIGGLIVGAVYFVDQVLPALLGQAQTAFDAWIQAQYAPF